jgi:hypothetical protein
MQFLCLLFNQMVKIIHCTLNIGTTRCFDHYMFILTWLHVPYRRYHPLSPVSISRLNSVEWYDGWLFNDAISIKTIYDDWWIMVRMWKETVVAFTCKSSVRMAGVQAEIWTAQQTHSAVPISISYTYMVSSARYWSCYRAIHAFYFCPLQRPIALPSLKLFTSD